MASRTDEMVRHLKALQMNTPDIEASAVVSVDGLIMASQLPADVEEDRVSAMSAAMLSLGDRIAKQLRASWPKLLAEMLIGLRHGFGWAGFAA